MKRVDIWDNLIWSTPQLRMLPNPRQITRQILWWMNGIRRRPHWYLSVKDWWHVLWGCLKGCVKKPRDVRLTLSRFSSKRWINRRWRGENIRSSKWPLGSCGGLLYGRWKSPGLRKKDGAEKSRPFAGQRALFFTHSCLTLATPRKNLKKSILWSWEGQRQWARRELNPLFFIKTYPSHCYLNRNKSLLCKF